MLRVFKLLSSMTRTRQMFGVVVHALQARRPMQARLRTDTASPRTSAFSCRCGGVVAVQGVSSICVLILCVVYIYAVFGVIAFSSIHIFPGK